MPAKTEEYTLGVEEEYQIINPETRALCPGAEGVLRRARRALGEERVVPELRASQLEALTPVLRTLSEVRAELLRLRRGVIQAAQEEGVRIAAASTHPFSHWREQPITAEERYRKILERERRMAEEQVVFGFHVHVGLSDRETAVQVMNRARAWLAPLLALSANSPFWLGEDTGYASYRTQIWGWLPTAGTLLLARRARCPDRGPCLYRWRNGGKPDLLGHEAAASVRYGRDPGLRRLHQHRRGRDASRPLPRPHTHLPRRSRRGETKPRGAARDPARRALDRLALRPRRRSRGRRSRASRPGEGGDREVALLHAPYARGTRRLGGSLDPRGRNVETRQRCRAPASGLRTCGAARGRRRRADRGDRAGNESNVTPRRLCK